MLYRIIHSVRVFHKTLTPFLFGIVYFQNKGYHLAARLAR